MICVVGNCTQPEDNVKRCYWSLEVGHMRGDVQNHAYLDLCLFHQGFFESRTCSAWSPGWDADE